MFRLFNKKSEGRKEETRETFIEKTVSIPKKEFPGSISNPPAIKEAPKIRVREEEIKVIPPKLDKLQNKSIKEEKKKFKGLRDLAKKAVEKTWKSSSSNTELSLNEGDVDKEKDQRRIIIQKKIKDFIDKDEMNESDYDKEIKKNKKIWTEEEKKERSNKKTSSNTKNPNNRKSSISGSNWDKGDRENSENRKFTPDEEEIFTKIFNVLKKYDGKLCNLMISTGLVTDYLSNEIFKQFDSTKWKLFYFDIHFSRSKMVPYDQVSDNFYLTVPCKNIIYEMGPIKYLKKLEEIDVCIIGEDVTVPHSEKYCIVDRCQNIMTDTFINDCVAEMYVVSPTKVISNSNFNYKTIKSKNTKEVQEGIFRKMVKKIGLK